MLNIEECPIRMKECWKEIITKTGNKTIKKMKTHKKDPGNQKRKNQQRQQQDHLHKLRLTVGMQQLITMSRSPFEQRDRVSRLLRIPRQTTSATNADVMDIGPESTERPTTAVNSELAGDLLCKKTNRDFFIIFFLR